MGSTPTFFQCNLFYFYFKNKIELLFVMYYFYLNEYADIWHCTYYNIRIYQEVSTQ